MSRTAKLLLLPAALLVMIVTAACGTERIGVAKVASQPAGGDLYHGAVLFSQRCAGCHTLSYAGTHGSAPNIRDAQGNSGPDFDQRCERPIDRVLYAIENGGFSGAYMPQNIVVGHDAVDVAKFVAQYSGTQIPLEPGLVKCQDKQIGTLPANTNGLKPSDQPNGSSSPTPGSHHTKQGGPTADVPGHAKKHAA
jgi:mono/diheme cytochrome c family protein